MNEALGSIFSGAIPSQFMGSQNTPADSAGPSDSKSNTQERIAKEIHTRVEEAKGLQQKSLELHEKADNTEDPEEAENIRHEAREIDKKAAKLMKIAERLEKGWIQGGAMGTGIGAGVASGLGLGVGALLTGVVAIPTAGLGLLIGAGTGLAHGSWVKFTDAFTKDEADEIVSEATEEAEKIAKG
ncbi:hypothetical protein FNAPI_5337 [Fusarium napiforme]|uniref:Uncharacterized protein n=1 Tax=Fusarium napiforme TaxID=42672 RepID=A0A8H5JLQ4_9HYPO|nr:hypothetical protein FNAPI_5337 [Fusarium napiforme]